MSDERKPFEATEMRVMGEHEEGSRKHSITRDLSIPEIIVEEVGDETSFGSGIRHQMSSNNSSGFDIDDNKIQFFIKSDDSDDAR